MKTISLEQAVAMIPDGATLMIGGFMAVGTPERVMDEIVRQGKRNLTVIANDTGTPRKGNRETYRGQAGAQGDRQPHRAKSRNAAANECRRVGGGTRPARHSDRAHPLRRVRPRRRPHSHGRRHDRRRGEAKDRSQTARPICSKPRSTLISRSFIRSLPIIWAI